MPDSLIGEPPTISDSDWETQSEHSVDLKDLSRENRLRSHENAQAPDLTLEQPVRKEDLIHLTEVPVSVLATAPSMSWCPALTYSNPNKCYERIMV